MTLTLINCPKCHEPVELKVHSLYEGKPELWYIDCTNESCPIKTWAYPFEELITLWNVTL